MEQAASRIQIRDEAAFNRWPLLRLPVVLRHPQSFQFQKRADQRHFRIHQEATVDAEASPAGARRGFLGRRNAGTPGEIAAGLQGNAQGNAVADGATARVYPKSDAAARL